METKVTFSVPGQKTLVAGRDRVTITAYDPRFLDVVDHDDDHGDGQGQQFKV